MGKYEEDLTKSWPSRYEWLNAAFGVKVKGEPFEQDMSLAIECRNAIVHGAGSLTKKQQNKFGAFVQLRRRLDAVLDIQVNGTRLVFSADSSARALKVGRSFIYGFDAVLTDLDVCVEC
jgi:hypothetical protein